MSVLNTKIIDFVNSKDIRKHWQEIGYEPSALEAAWLVWQSKNHTVEEKHKAWKEIIDRTEDCNIPAGVYTTSKPQLHEFLERYISTEDNLISSFYKTEDNAVYSYRMYFDDDSYRDWYNVPMLFGSFDEAYAQFKENDEPPYANFVEFVKTCTGAEVKKIFLRFNLKNEIVRVDEANCLTNEKDFEIYEFGFQEMNFEFPLPFKKGDIIRRVKGMYTIPSWYYENYVFDSVVKDRSYTVVKGYSADADGNIQHESIHLYMDCEYMTLPLGDKDNILTPISKYLSGELDLALLLGAYRYIIGKYELRAQELYHLHYTKEEKKLAGIEYEA